MTKVMFNIFKTHQAKVLSPVGLSKLENYQVQSPISYVSISVDYMQFSINVSQRCASRPYLESTFYIILLIN